MPLHRFNRFKRSLINQFPFCEVVEFSEGLHGFQQLRHFSLSGNQQELPFLWIESVQNEKVSFVVIDPFLIFPTYTPTILKSDIAFLGANEKSKLFLLAIVNPKKRPFTANLSAPLLIHWEAKKGKQILMPEDSLYPFEI